MLFKILRFMISYKTLIDPKPLRIRFDKIDGFLESLVELQYLRLTLVFMRNSAQREKI